MASFSFAPKAEAGMHRDSDELVDGEWTKLYLPDPSDMAWFHRRPSVPNSPSPPLVPPSSRLKRRDRAPGSADSHPSSHGRGNNVDDFGSKSSESGPSTAYHSTHSAPFHAHYHHGSSTLPSRNRTSLLSAASDALGLRKKIGSVSRRKPNSSPLPNSTSLMPEVIEISARNNTTVTATVAGTTAHRDYEHEERERLRDVAAQSIGLGPGLHDSYMSQSRLSLDSLPDPPQPPRMPPFPVTLAALRPFAQLTATLPKFTPPSSLLVYALAKQWKSRTFMLTSHPPTHKAHVHLFKGTSKDEKEIERLEVTEDSVIFVAEEEVGGRGNVVKFAGKDVSAKRSGSAGEESSRTMWFLQITDPAESQRWIAAIKRAVLTQRALRAGLDIPAQTIGGNEPKGDMDVMLSMHLQGIIAMHPTKPSPPSPPMPTSPSPSASLRSLRMSATSSPSPTTATKGMFSGTRPRSPSIEGSTTPSAHTEDSFGVVGASLLTMLRNKSSADSSSSPSHSLPVPLAHVSGKDSPAPSLRSAYAPVVITASDLKISKERDVPDLPTADPIVRPSSTLPVLSTPPTPSLTPLGLLTLSLQPPPRKSKIAAAAMTPATAPHEQQALYRHAGGNRSVAGNFGIPSRSFDDAALGESSPTSPDSPTFSDGHSESFLPNLGFEAPSSSFDEENGSEGNEEVTPTLLINGTMSRSPPGGRFVPTDKFSQSIVITKRWSRQGVPLPKQPTPPSGPPPSIPPSSGNNPRTSGESSISIPVSHSADHSPGGSSSNSRSRPRIGTRSSSPLSPTFWKRVSASSTYTASSINTSDSRGQSLIPLSSAGDSFPSSLRSAVSIGASSSRPMSLSVPDPPPMTHIATNKRRSMPPPRPAPNFAPPPAPITQETARPGSAPVPQKSLRSSIAHRALRLSLTSPKPPPSSALPPRPDEPVIPRGHRRSSSTGTPDPRPTPGPSSLPTSVQSGDARPNPSTPPPSRSLSIRQRLRILSTPSTLHSRAQSPSRATPSLQVSTLDLSDDNDDDLPTPHFHAPQPFGLGEHIVTMTHEPSFLQLLTPVSPTMTMPKPPPRNPLRLVPAPLPPSTSDLRPSTPPLELDRDFVALSPPPPRKGSRPNAFAATRAEKNDAERPGSAPRPEDGLGTLSQRGSVVSLGFVTT